MKDYVTRAIGGRLLLATRRASRNRRAYGSGPGLRVVGLHAEDTDHFDKFRRFVEWCGEQLPFAEPQVLDAPSHLTARGTDALLVTIDDGHARTFRALEWLSQIGVRVTYFVIPSYVGRSVREFLGIHASRGVTAFNIGGQRDQDRTRGFDVSQLRELELMGHRIGAHNDAHRNLSELRSADLQYEIVDGVDRLAQLLGHSVDDFAWAFGRIGDLSPEALRVMRDRCTRVYSCVRGLNVPGVTSAVILRDPVSVDFPRAFTAACLHGALDHRYQSARDTLIQMAGRLSAQT